MTSESTQIQVTNLVNDHVQDQASLDNNSKRLVDLDPAPKEGWQPNIWRLILFNPGPGFNGPPATNYCSRSVLRFYKLKSKARAPIGFNIPFRYGLHFSWGLKADQLEAQTDGTLISQELQAKWRVTTRNSSQFFPMDSEVADQYYLVLGLLHSDQTVSEVMTRIKEPKTRFKLFKTSDSVFKALRRAIHYLRPLPVRLMSLKRMTGLGLYECNPKDGSHTEVRTTPEAKKALRELWRAYTKNRQDDKNRWRDWIHKNLNNSSMNTQDGQLSLKLELEWSPIRLAVWGLTPFFLSLAIGLWYSSVPHGTADRVTIVQTGWTIASYIVGGGARKPIHYLVNATCS